MTRRKVHRLPLEQWPPDDRARWQAAIAGGDVFDEAGRAAHLSDKTRLNLCYAYGQFLGFLDRHHPDLLQRAAPQRVTREIVAEYAETLRQRCQESSVASELAKVRHMLRMLHGDASPWLLTVIKRIAARARRTPKVRPHITSDRLYQLGIDLMDRARAAAAGTDVRRSSKRPSRTQSESHTCDEYPQNRRPSSDTGQSRARNVIVRGAP